MCSLPLSWHDLMQLLLCFYIFFNNAFYLKVVDRILVCNTKLLILDSFLCSSVFQRFYSSGTFRKCLHCSWNPMQPSVYIATMA